MSEKKWIKQLPIEKGSRKKEYKITEYGLSILEYEIERLRELVKNGELIVGGEKDE